MSLLIAGQISYSFPLLAVIARLAERLNLLRVDLSTSSGDSYAAGSYFVGSMPGWFVVRLGVISKTPLY